MTGWPLRVICTIGVVTGCGSTSTSATSTSSAARLPSPCSFLSQTTAVQISGDPAITNQAADVTEAGSGYVACVFADAMNEANSVAVRLKRVRRRADLSTLRDAATFFSLGEPVQPFQPIPVAGIGDGALGETTPGVAFIVFSSGDLVVDVGVDSSSLSAASLRARVENLARQVAQALPSAIRAAP